MKALNINETTPETAEATCQLAEQFIKIINNEKQIKPEDKHDTKEEKTTVN